MTTSPAITTSIGDAATNMTARHFRHPPVARSEPGHLGLTLPQYPVLSVAAAEPGLSGAELARDCMLTRAGHRRGHLAARRSGPAAAPARRP